MKSILYSLSLFLLQLPYSQSKNLEPGQTTTKASSARINGKGIDYKVTTANQALFEEKKLIATMHYIYYKKDRSNLQERPLHISLN